ncbi:hypothetical protein [Kistimonas scapharcae]
MTGFYESKARLVVEMLKKYGRPVVLVRDTGKVCDPVTGVCTPGEPEQLQFNGVLKSYKQGQIDGTTIMQGDKLLILDASHEPQPGDLAHTADGDWQIVGIESLNPAGVPLAYRVQVRR